MIILDTDILIDYLRREEYSIQFISENTSKIFLTRLTLLELLAGARSKVEQEEISNYFDFSFVK